MAQKIQYGNENAYVNNWTQNPLRAVLSAFYILESSVSKLVKEKAEGSRREAMVQSLVKTKEKPNYKSEQQ